MGYMIKQTKQRQEQSYTQYKHMEEWGFISSHS